MSFQTRVVGPLRRDRHTFLTAFFRNRPVRPRLGMVAGCGFDRHSRRGPDQHPESDRVRPTAPVCSAAPWPNRPVRQLARSWARQRGGAAPRDNCATWRIHSPARRSRIAPLDGSTTKPVSTPVCATWRIHRPRVPILELRHLARRHEARAVGGRRSMYLRDAASLFCGATVVYDTRHARSARFRSEFSSSPCRHPPHHGGTT